LREAGIVRLVDLLLVERDAEGAIHTVEETWLAPHDLQRLNELRDRAPTSADSETGDGSEGAARPSGWVR
jgi:hypothetical protein